MTPFCFADICKRGLPRSLRRPPFADISKTERSHPVDILIVMCMGILVGRLFRSGRIKKVNELLSLACTFVLIFAMGGTLGQRENFVREFLSLGGASFLFFAFPTFFSIVFVYILTRNFMGRKKYETRGKKEK